MNVKLSLRLSTKPHSR